MDLDVIDGYRAGRRSRLWSYALAGRQRGLDGIYVESSTFLPAETDLAFLGLSRALGIPVLTYVRDAYQLFPEYYPRDTLKRRLGAAAFLPALRAMRAVSSHLAFPTAGLAEAVLGPDAASVLLPPGAPPPIDVPRSPTANRILYVGDARLQAHGADRLIAAVDVARSIGPGSRARRRLPPGPGTDHAASGVAARAPRRGPRDPCAAARRPGHGDPAAAEPYNDLALPIKLFDYLSYGRPLLVTDCTEQARVVNRAGAGVVMGDEPEAMAAAIRGVAEASEEQRQAWSTSAHDAARAASWEHRARQIVDILREGT